MLLDEATEKAVKCNICESTSTGHYLSWRELDVYQCAGCGTAFTYPQPEQLDVQYCESYFDTYNRRRNFRLKRSNKRLERLEMIKPGGRILDIGCSLGYFVETAQKRGWDAYGVEISEYAAGVAAKSGLKVKQGILEDAAYEDNFFDCVTMWDVLEHVPDPTAHMLEVRRILKPGGLVVIGTPNISHPLARIKMMGSHPDWRHFKPAEHIFYFTPRSIRMLLSKCNFTPVKAPVVGKKRRPITSVLADVFGRMLPVIDVMVVYGINKEK